MGRARADGVLISMLRRRGKKEGKICGAGFYRVGLWKVTLI